MEYVDENEQGTDVREYMGVLHRRRNAVVLVFAVVFLSTAIFTFRAPNVYEATSTLIVEAGDERSSLPFAYLPVGRNLLQNYCELLRSTTLAERVVSKLRASSSARFLKESSNPVEYIEEEISVRPIRETDLIKVSARARSAKDAALIANAVVEEFVEQQLSVVRGEFAEQRRFLEEQLPVVESKLTESESELKEFKESNQLVSLSEETREQTRKLLEFDLLYGQAETDYDAATRRLEYLKNQLAEQKQSLSEAVTRVASPFVLELRKELVTLETDYSLFLVQGLSQDHPRLLTLKKSIDEVKNKLREETKKILDENLPVSDPLSFSHELADKILGLEVEVVALRAKKDALSRIRNEFSSRLRSLPEKELHLARLEREYEINAKTYSMLMEKYEEVKIAEAGKIANVRIVDRATVPDSPVRPRKKLNLLLGVLVGIGLGLGAAFLLEHMDASVRNLADVERYVNLAVLGAVPNIRTKVDRKDQIADIASHLITHQIPKSPISEVFRTIRTNLQFVNPDNPVKTILVTSSVPQEGKTTVAANLAIVLAQMGAKTLLVDADLRKPVMHRLFDVDSSDGLTDVLTGGAGLSSVVKPTDIKNLRLLPAGSIPPNPSELLGSERMKSVVQTLRNHFEYVVFDSPPATPVTDPAVLGASVDGTVIVLQMGSTDRSAVMRTKEVLENVRATLIGVVLNNTTAAHTGYARYRYYQYYPYPSPESVWRRRLGYKTGIFLIGVVSAVAVTLGWFYWAMRSTPVTDSDREDVAAMETGPPAEQAAGTTEETSAGDVAESGQAPEEQTGPVFTLSEEAPVEEEEPTIDESPSRPEVIPAPRPEKPIKDITVLFEKGNANVKPEYYDELEAVAAALKKDPEIKIEIRGYTDDSEAREEQLVLSQNRAAAVAARLTKAHGVELNRLSFMGYGPANPVGDNSVPEGRALNRRVEFRIQEE